MTASAFVVRHLCPALPTASRPGSARADRALLVELESWLVPKAKGGIGEGPWRKSIIDTASAQRFAVAVSGAMNLRVDQLIDPRGPLAAAFASTLAPWLPAKWLVGADEDRSYQMLAALGMQATPSDKCIVACAEALDAHASSGEQPSDEVQQQSWLLVDAVCARLKDVWLNLRNLRAKGQLAGIAGSRQEVRALEAFQLAKEREQMLLSVAAKRIALVTSPREDASAYVAWLGTNILPSSFYGPSSLFPGLQGHVPPPPPPEDASPQLAPLREMLLTPECEIVAWSQVRAWAREAGQPPHRDPNLNPNHSPIPGVHTLAAQCAEEALSKLGCYGARQQLPLARLLQQLKTVTAALPAHNVAFYSRLISNMTELYTALDIALARIKSAQEDVPSADEALLEELSQLPCLPLRVSRDASGALTAGGVVRFVAPRRCFFNLPSEAVKQPHLRALEGTDRLHTLKAAAEALGVREEPELDDWVTCLRLVGEQSAARGVLLPNESTAAVYALRMVLENLRASAAAGAAPAGTGASPLLPLYMLSEPQDGQAPARLLPAAQLVWLDRPALRHRCTSLPEGVSFVRAFEGVPNDQHHVEDYQRLCEHSALRRLSDVVRERLLQLPARVGPSPAERQVEVLLRSAYFASGLALLARAPEQVERA